MKFEPFSARYGSTPDIEWRRLNENGGTVGFDPELGLSIVAGRDAARTAMMDDRFSSARTGEPVRPLSPIVWQILGALDLPAVNPDSDRALRAVWPNTAQRVEQQWGDLVRDRVEQLVDELAGHDGEVDLIAEVARRLPLLVAVDLLGIPAADAPKVKQWTDGQTGLTWGDLDEDNQIRAAIGLVELSRYCQRHVAGKAAFEAWQRCFDDVFLATADSRSLAEAWAVAHYNADHPDGAAALRRVDQRLRRLHPVPMDYFDMLREMGTPPTLALVDVVAAADPDATHHTAWERHLHAIYHNIPLAPVVGKEAIADNIASFIRPGPPGIERIEFRVINIAADGPVVMTERVDVFTLPDKSFELPVMGTFEVSDGKIKAWRDYFDTNQFTSRMG
jgi:limonene-1,2-epoxide hydrolase